MSTLQFRPHHFLCTIGFQGRGYSPAFVANFADIAAQLRGPHGDQVAIEVVAQTDSICAPCPNKRGALCSTQAKIETLDKAHAAALNIKAGNVLMWGEAKQRIREQVSLERFHAICKSCSWKALGICEQALTDLISNR